MLNICVCIPVRYNSKRLPGKPLLVIDNETIIEKTYKQVLKSKYIKKEDVYIMTDNKYIEQNVKSFGCCGDNIIMTDVHCENALQRISKYLHLLPKKYDTILNVHGDEPYINPKNIDYLIENFSNESTLLYRKLTLEESKKTSTVKIVTGKNNNILYCSRFAIPYSKNKNYNNYIGIIGIHIFKRDTLAEYHKDISSYLYKLCNEDIEELKFIEMGYSIKGIKAPHKNEISLNTEEDFQYLINKYVSY